jgi:acyl carrier protein
MRRDAPAALAAEWALDALHDATLAPPLLRDLLKRQSTSIATASGASTDTTQAALTEALITTPASTNAPTLPDAVPVIDVASVLDTVRRETAVVLGHASAQAVDSDVPFDRIGLDSLATVELRNRIAKETGVRLPATFIYDWPTPAHLANHLNELANPSTEGGAS